MHWKRTEGTQPCCRLKRDSGPWARRTALSEDRLQGGLFMAAQFAFYETLAFPGGAGWDLLGALRSLQPYIVHRTVFGRSVPQIELYYSFVF